MIVATSDAMNPTIPPVKPNTRASRGIPPYCSANRRRIPPPKIPTSSMRTEEIKPRMSSIQANTFQMVPMTRRTANLFFIATS